LQQSADRGTASALRPDSTDAPRYGQLRIRPAGVHPLSIAVSATQPAVIVMEWFIAICSVAVFAGTGVTYGVILAHHRVGRVYGDLDAAWKKVSRQACIIDMQAGTIDRLLQRPDHLVAPDGGISATASTRRSRSGR
jgi:hypothetical protein